MPLTVRGRCPPERPHPSDLTSYERENESGRRHADTVRRFRRGVPLLVTDKCGDAPLRPTRSYARQMSATRTRRCAHCGGEFTSARKPGPAPKYCSHAHRQQAYQIRRGTTGRTGQDELTEEVQRLQARIRRLEHDNTRLREELTETSREMGRLYRELHPTPPALAALTGQPEPIHSPAHTVTRKLRWGRGTDT